MMRTAVVSWHQPNWIITNDNEWASLPFHFELSKDRKKNRSRRYKVSHCKTAAATAADRNSGDTLH